MLMNLVSLREYCLSLPHTTEGMQWGDHVLFRIGGKMYAITTVEVAAPTVLSFKCTPERFAELVERDGVIPAPYMARNHWVALERWDALDDREGREAVAASYELVRSQLPRKVVAALGGSSVQLTRAAGSAPVRRTRPVRSPAAAAARRARRERGRT
jgi:predicted DNA-binding protein (MmcQ/YjbR family)